jgi:septal ring factor EnvC (AmiA/AmiB activator)
LHYFLGLGWDEWASIVAILSSVIVGTGWLFKRIFSSMLEPIYDELKELSKNFKQLNKDFEKRERSITQLDKRLDGLESRLVEQETNIKNLNREVFEHED